MNRDTAIALMLRLEGGDANVKGDSGGHTKYGITQATLDEARRTWVNMPANVGDLHPADAELIYRNVQWVKIRGDELPSTIAPLMLNAAVNMGEPRAVMLLQECLGVLIDGAFGSATLAAIGPWKSGYQPDQTLAQEYAAHVAHHYAALNAADAQFELGWFRRLFLVYTLALIE